MASAHDADAVVVGSGLGGLTAAAYLAALGKRVLDAERDSKVGGCGGVFTMNSYEFDIGLHYIGDCGPDGMIPSVLGPLGIDLTFREMDPDGFDTVIFPDQTFRFPKGVDAFRERLLEAFPAQRA